jgi:DNA-binding NtrC family response regulator
MRATREHFPHPKNLSPVRGPESSSHEGRNLSAPVAPTHGITALAETGLEGRSIKVNWLRYYREALPLLRGEDPPHLVFTEALLPDGTWADVVKLALEALKPVKVIVVSRLIDVRLYVETMAGGAFDFIVPPMTSDELAHILACAVESVSNQRRTQAMAAAV